MSRRRRLGIPLLAGAAVAGAAFADEARRDRLRRTARVWRLTARRAAHYGVVKVSGAYLSALLKMPRLRYISDCGMMSVIFNAFSFFASSLVSSLMREAMLL